MTCDVSSCGRKAAVAVVFRHGSKLYGYCGFHGYDKQRRLRWDAKHIRDMRKLR